ncbi:hypothetical protein [Nonomuraea sp. NPDC050643]|uniref:hypothetical protein n=1 Tax=Nonomuraea sp. NPDC050643 TaxID=3155660 RepID=UPI0033D087FA
MTTTVAPARRRRYVGLSAAVAGVAAATTAVIMLTGVGGGPAYAVTKGSDGGVSVTISSFTDPDGLEADLAAAGVTSVVDYLPQGQTCKQPRGEAGDPGGPFMASIRKEGDGIGFTIEKGQVPAGSTLVLTVSKSEDGDDRPPFATALQIVKGTVAPCEAVSMPVPPPGSGGSERKDDEPGVQRETREEGPSLNTETG